jgi:hypothetical protein
MRPLQAGIAQLVEHDLAKVGVASSSLVSRSILFIRTQNRPARIRLARCLESVRESLQRASPPLGVGIECTDTDVLSVP